MKKIISVILTAAVCIVSCNKPGIEGQQSDKGSLSFSVTEMGDFITVQSKAVDYTDFSNYDVVIDGPDKISEKYSTFRGRVVELGSGHYTITVTSPGTEPAAFEQPIYQAHEEFDIKAGEVTDLKLVCEPLNCKVTFELSDNFKKELATYEAVVTNGLGSLTWTRDASKDDFGEGKAGYFLPRGLVVNVKGHRSIDDSEATAQYIVENPVAGQHHIIKLDAKVTGQIGGIDIKVNTEFNDVENNLEIGGIDESYVDRPDFNGSEGGDDPEEPSGPVIIWDANPFFDPLYEIRTGSVVDMVVQAPAGLKTFLVNVSPNFKDAIKVVTQQKYPDNPVDYIDLITDADIWQQFQGLPTGDDVKGKEKLDFSLTPFVDMLLSVAENGMEVEFTLMATDNDDEPILTSSQELPVVSLKIFK